MLEISPELGLLSHWVYACLVLVDVVNFLTMCESSICSTSLVIFGIVTHA